MDHWSFRGHRSDIRGVVVGDAGLDGAAAAGGAGVILAESWLCDNRTTCPELFLFRHRPRPYRLLGRQRRVREFDELDPHCHAKIDRGDALENEIVVQLSVGIPRHRPSRGAGWRSTAIS